MRKSRIFFNCGVILSYFSIAINRHYCYDEDLNRKVGEKIPKMKNNIKVIAASFILIWVSAFITFVDPVNAQIELTEEQYAKLNQLFTPGRISILTDEEIDYYLSLDDEDITTAHKYYKVIETENGTITQEVSEFEAMMGANSMMSLPGTVGTLSTFYQTTYKKINIARLVLSNNKSDVFLSTEWLVTPAVKSFDVTGLRVFDGSVDLG